MPSFVTATVTEVDDTRPGLQRVVTVRDGAPEPERAYVLTQLTGPVEVGDRVIMNTTGVELGLGTGGWHVVHWNLSRERWSSPGAGHIMKLRYTSLQVDTGAAEEPGDLDGATLGGVPVVATTVHSQVAVVAAACRAVAPDTRIVYVMTDGAALPLVLSDLAADLVTTGTVDGTVTAGHAFGGDLEAVSVPSALVLARHRLDAGVVVVGMGPGVVGTGTRLGTTAVEAAEILDTGAALGGTPILAVRASRHDVRTRHRDISHHTGTVLALARPGVVVPLPDGVDLDVDEIVDSHTVERHAVPDMAAVLAARGLSVTTMGRGPGDDPLFFASAGAAGIAAGLRSRA